MNCSLTTTLKSVKSVVSTPTTASALLTTMTKTEVRVEEPDVDTILEDEMFVSILPFELITWLNDYELDALPGEDFDV